MRWEYRVSCEERDIESLGKDGWEMVSAVSLEGKLKIFYKRPFPGLQERMTLEQRGEAYRKYKVEMPDEKERNPTS